MIVFGNFDGLDLKYSCKTQNLQAFFMIQQKFTVFRFVLLECDHLSSDLSVCQSTDGILISWHNREVVLPKKVDQLELVLQEYMLAQKPPQPH